MNAVAGSDAGLGFVIASQFMGADPQKAVELARPSLVASGAHYVHVSKTFAGGEMTGVVSVGSRWDSMDAGSAGYTDLLAKPEVQAEFTKPGQQHLGRVVGRVTTESGDCAGSYVGVSVLDSALSADEADAIIDPFTSVLNDSGCNGARSIAWTAAGPSTGTQATLVYTDSLDSYAKFLAGFMASDALVGMLVNSGRQIVSRTLAYNY
ncbi:MAG: hypothetical protein CL409_06155 [Acidimicrobiaceae bacterium]|nr:hypothetical protein [Acidimicrobiaceae bacterium]